MAKKDKVEWRHRTKPAAISLATQFFNISFIISFIQLFFEDSAAIFTLSIEILLLLLRLLPRLRFLGENFRNEWETNAVTRKSLNRNVKFLAHPHQSEPDTTLSMNGENVHSTSKNHWKKFNENLRKIMKTQKPRTLFLCVTHKNKQQQQPQPSC